MAEPAPARDPFDGVISLVAGPIAAVIRSFDQLRRGADELINGLENFNRTMRNLNDTAERVNGLLNDFEQPVRTIVPQIVRTVGLAEDLADRVSGPIDQVVPGLTRLADTLNSPVLTTLPSDIGAFVEAINDLVRRLSPLGQMAESASGLFGLRLPGFGRPTAATPAPPAAVEVVVPVIEVPPEKPPPAKRKAAAKKAAAKRAPVTRTAPAKRSTSR